MKRVVYSKLNSYRKPEYRIKTSIVLENNQVYVEKAALTSAAISHIDRIKSNYERLKGLYKSIYVIPCEEIKKGVIRFPYVGGEPIYSPWVSIEEEINPEYIVPFKMSTEFSEVFPDCFPSEGEPAVSIANLDDVLSNRIMTKNGVVLFDYEWVFDFPVPISFLDYRRAFINFYRDPALRESESWDEYKSRLGYEDTELFNKMEEHFQLYANGEIYVGSYKKSVNRLADIVETNALLQLEYQGITNSNSWRITAPLRKIAAIFK